MPLWYWCPHNFSNPINTDLWNFIACSLKKSIKGVVTFYFEVHPNGDLQAEVGQCMNELRWWNDTMTSKGVINNSVRWKSVYLIWYHKKKGGLVLLCATLSYEQAWGQWHKDIALFWSISHFICHWALGAKGVKSVFYWHHYWNHEVLCERSCVC